MSEIFKDGNKDFRPNLMIRKTRAGIWNTIFLVSTLIGVLSLVTLVVSILDSCFGYVVTEASVDPSDVGINDVKKLPQKTQEELVQLIKEARANDYITENRYNILESEKPLVKRSTDELLQVIGKEILQVKIKKSWSLYDSLTKGDQIKADAGQNYPDGVLQFRSWINADFLAGDQTSDPQTDGIRGAIIGSLWIIFIAILFALPIGIGAAIYLEEYAKDTRFNRFIQTNIYNLAGVPSIIYGMLGLAIFVVLMGGATSGQIFGAKDVMGVQTPDGQMHYFGRTVFSAGLTLGILILPIIIINTQEALKAIPQSLRYSSYGVGATKWQTIWHHVIPAALDRILTGTVFAISRAIGETAPLVVVGASTFLTIDPSGLFSKFTTLPMQVYTLSKLPQDENRKLAAAAIIVLLILLLGLNTVAIIFRNRIKKQKEAL